MGKHIVFDFDGTLASSKANIWRRIYMVLGYDTGDKSRYKQDLKAFLDGKLEYNEWCKINATDYRCGGLTRNVLDTLMTEISLYDDTVSTIKALYDRGCRVHIVSGNIVYVIEQVLSEVMPYIDSIHGNEFIFDKDGHFIDIVPTQYDCEGKAKYIEELANRENLHPQDIYFVGNGINDEWVYTSGCTTICINAEDTDSADRNIWHREICKLSEILDIV